VYYYLLLALVAVSTFVALSNWRKGIFLMILIAAVQDPVRKLTPGTPGYLVLSSTIVFIAAIIGAYQNRLRLWRWFRRSYGKLSFAARLFLISLVPAALVTLSLGSLGALLVIMIGLLTYLTLIFGLLIGFSFVNKPIELRKVLAFYCVVTAIMLIGTPLEYFKLFQGWPALGTKALNMEWIRYTGDAVINLIAGFYRSPDVMGWHAVVATMLSIVLALSSRGNKRLFWIVIAAWCGAAAMLCGRRKMFLMLPLFSMVLLWLYLKARHRSRTVAIIGILIGVSICGYLVYDFMGRDTGLEGYYFRRFGELPERVKDHGFDSLVATYNQSGFFGEGLGTATTGAHHLTVARPSTWQEGGLEKLMVELGVPGLLCFLLLAYRLLRISLNTAIRQITQRSEDYALISGLGAIFVANAASFFVSHQIFGDPFIMTFFSFLTGLLLSAGGVKHAGPQEQAVASTALGQGRWVSPSTPKRFPSFEKRT